MAFRQGTEVTDSLPKCWEQQTRHQQSCAGKVKATDVMFPSGSPELVGPVYQNPILSAPFNEQLAAAVQSYCNDMLQVLACCPQAMYCMLCLVLMQPLTEGIGKCSPHICGRRA